MLSRYFSCTFCASVRKMEQAGGDRAVCTSAGPLCSLGDSWAGASAWKHCSLLQLCDDLLTPLESIIYPRSNLAHCHQLLLPILCSAEMHSLISLLDIIFHSTNLQDPLEEAAHPRCLLHDPTASPPLPPLASLCQ